VKRDPPFYPGYPRQTKIYLPASLLERPYTGKNTIPVRGGKRDRLALDFYPSHLDIARFSCNFANQTV
jgi:hypothetical protein